MITMTYKGYTASVMFDDIDGILVGRVLGIRDVIDCEGESIGELERDFRGAIDSYLAACAKTGKKPDDPCSGGLFLRLPPEIFTGLARAAETTGRSLDQLVADAVRAAYLEKKPLLPPPPGTRGKRKGVMAAGIG